LCTKKKQRKKKKKKGRKVEQQQQCELCDRQKHGKISANDRFQTINFTLKLQLQMSINIVTNTYFQAAFRNAKKYCYKYVSPLYVSYHDNTIYCTLLLDEIKVN
jgi:hypothetical protein